MFHTIEFVVDLAVNLETSPRDPLERRLLQEGVLRRAQLRPHVVESKLGPIEVADLFFEDGTAVRDVRFAFFRFVD